MNNKFFHLFWLGNVPIRDSNNGNQTARSKSGESDFTPSIFLAATSDIFYNYTVILKSLIWLGMVFIVFYLLPANASGGDQIFFKVWIRDISMLRNKLANSFIQVFVGLPNCWIKLKQPHMLNGIKPVGKVTLPVNYPSLTPYSFLSGKILCPRPECFELRLRSWIFSLWYKV